ncbi:MAG: murein transglycosylase A [Dongiaceae bacterium]
MHRSIASMAALLVAACAVEAIAPSPAQPAAPLPIASPATPAEVADLPGWRADQVAEALPALAASCAAFAKRSDGDSIGPNAGQAADWRAACQALPTGANDENARRYLETWFAIVLVSDAGDADGLFTGYFEPELAGARRRSAQFPVPLYRPPPDLVSREANGEKTFGRMVGGALVPYYTRAEIEAGALEGRKLELLWLADPIDAFFLQVQGSGQVKLPDGSVVRVGYAANNGHSYTAIGRVLVERGELSKEAATMQTVRDWLRAHPDAAPALMRQNPRYIYFRELEGPGPVGALGVVLTPGRSLAVDPEFMPLGAPVWLDTTFPAATPEAGRPLRRLVVAQDKGGAIKGAVRGDIYFGSGERALAYAGLMKQRGRYFLLVPKPVAARMKSAS